MSHHELISTIIDLVRASGAAEALAALRRDRPVVVAGRYHDTLAVFHVWAVERLVAGGLGDAAIAWHPLTHPESPLAWWDVQALASPSAATSFVPPTRATPGEPVPADPRATAGSARVPVAA